MPSRTLLFYQEAGCCPVLQWLQQLSPRVQAKAQVRLERLASLGHQLRRPEAAYLGSDICELRWRHQKVQYRILYFFHGHDVVVLTQGLTKQKVIPKQELAVAVRRKKAFEQNPSSHTFALEK